MNIIFKQIVIDFTVENKIDWTNDNNYVLKNLSVWNAEKKCALISYSKKLTEFLLNR